MGGMKSFVEEVVIDVGFVTDGEDAHIIREEVIDAGGEETHVKYATQNFLVTNDDPGDQKGDEDTILLTAIRS